MNAGLAERLRRVAGDDGPPSLEAFDASNEVHVNDAARHLLNQFRQGHDVEAFQLLFEVARPRLAQLATQITRRLSPAVDPDDLVSSFMVRLFTDVRGRLQAPVRHFLALAYTSMRNEVLDHLRQHKRTQANAQTWSQMQVPPVDPAHEAEITEQDRIFEGLGNQVLSITSECFAELDQRDQQVLIAREIVHLPYDRVAAMLKLAPDQVGMIIRRARMHLADRIVERLTTLATEDSDADEEDVCVLRETVLSCLESKGRAKNVKALVTHMLDMAANSAKRKLADLLYEMAKACLVEHPGFTERMLIHREPREAEEVAVDLKQVETRLGSVRDDVDIDDVASLIPDHETALGDARRCLDTLAEVEGRSGRQQVAVALSHIYSGDPETAETILRKLQNRKLRPVTRQNVSRNLTLALLRQKRFEEALNCAEAAASEWPNDPVRVMNLCFASARLGDRERFESNVKLLCSLHRHAPTVRVEQWLTDLLPALSRDLGLPRRRLDRLRRDAAAVDVSKGDLT